MAALTFEARFAELRSLSQQAPERAVFEAALGHLVSMSSLAYGRFEDEALPYAAAFMERWYADNPVRGVDPSSPFLVARDRALAGLQQRARWLEITRELDLHRLGKVDGWRALTSDTHERLRRVEVLHIKQARVADPQLLRAALGSPLFTRQLVALSLEGVFFGEALTALSAWADAPPVALRFLELGGPTTRGWRPYNDESHMALRGVREVTASYPMWRAAQPQLAGTWLEGRLSYKLDMGW